MFKHVFIFKFFAVSYLLNFFWESWHAYYLYWGYAGVSFADYSISGYLKLMSKVSLVDAGILTIIFLIGFFVWRDLGWLCPLGLKLNRWAYFLTATIGIAAFIEIKGVYILKEWSYLETMPTIFGLGLSPLVQLATTGLLALYSIKQYGEKED